MAKQTGLGFHLRSIRESKKLPLVKLAAKVKVDPAYLCRVEAGKAPISDKLLRKLARPLSLDASSLAILAGDVPFHLRRLIASNPKKAHNLLSGLELARTASIAADRGDPDQLDTPARYTVIDLFAGAGGFTQGFVDTGRFQSVFANDFDQNAAASYNYNFGEHCKHGDINAILADKNIDIPKADVVIGGPPCQGFSLLNKKREGDPRKELWRAYMEVVRRAEPSIFVMENVPELLKSQEYLEIQAIAATMGYRVTQEVLNAADFGVAQRRKRAIVVGSRIGVPELPAKTHYDPAKYDSARTSGVLPWETVERRIGDLPKPEGITHRVLEVKPPMDLHFGRTPLQTSLERYRAVPEGGNRFDLLKNRPDLTPGCWKRKKSGGTDLFGRLWWDKPAFTIRTEFFKPEKGRYLHPSQHRPITHREAARLQSFPDKFVFIGSNVSIARQIGNAVPPLLGKKIAEKVVVMLDRANIVPAERQHEASLAA